MSLRSSTKIARVVMARRGVLLQTVPDDPIEIGGEVGCGITNRPQFGLEILAMVDVGLPRRTAPAVRQIVQHHAERKQIGTRVFPRDPDFARKAGRILDLSSAAEAGTDRVGAVVVSGPYFR